MMETCGIHKLQGHSSSLFPTSLKEIRRCEEDVGSLSIRQGSNLPIADRTDSSKQCSGLVSWWAGVGLLLSEPMKWFNLEQTCWKVPSTQKSIPGSLVERVRILGCWSHCLGLPFRVRAPSLPSACGEVHPSYLYHRPLALKNIFYLIWLGWTYITMSSIAQFMLLVPQ